MDIDLQALKSIGISSDDAAEQMKMGADALRDWMIRELRETAADFFDYGSKGTERKLLRMMELLGLDAIFLMDRQVCLTRRTEKVWLLTLDFIEKTPIDLCL